MTKNDWRSLQNHIISTDMQQWQRHTIQNHPAVADHVKSILGNQHISKEDLVNLLSNWRSKNEWGCYIDNATGDDVANERGC